MKVILLSLLLGLCACSTTPLVPENPQRGVAQSGYDKADLREFDELRWQIEIYQHGGPRTHQDLKDIRHSTASSKERAAMIRSLECDPSTRTVSINGEEQTWSSDPCYFSGLPEWHLFSWDRFNIRKIPTTAEQLRSMIVGYDKETHGSPEEIYEVTLSDKRRVLVMNTSLPMKALFPQNREAAKKVVVRNGRLILLKQVNPTQFTGEGEIFPYQFIPESF